MGSRSITVNSRVLSSLRREGEQGVILQSRSGCQGRSVVVGVCATFECKSLMSLLCLLLLLLFTFFICLGFFLFPFPCHPSFPLLWSFICTALYYRYRRCSQTADTHTRCVERERERGERGGRCFHSSVALERSVGEERMIAASSFRAIRQCFCRLQQQHQHQTQTHKYTLTLASVNLSKTFSSTMPNTPPPVPSPEREMAEQQQLKAVVTGRLHRDSEADEWDSFLDSSSTFNPNAYNKRELAHRFASLFCFTAHSPTRRLYSLFTRFFIY